MGKVRAAEDACAARRRAVAVLQDAAGAGQGLLVDTCVYINALRGHLPDLVHDLLDLRTNNHSTIDQIFGDETLDITENVGDAPAQAAVEAEPQYGDARLMAGRHEKIQAGEEDRSK